MRHAALWGITVLLGFGLVQRSLAQEKTYRVDVEQRVEQGELVLEVYIERTGPEAFSLASSNFSFYLSDAYLNLAGAALDPEGEGRWSSTTDSRGYLPLELKRKDNFLVLNVQCKSQFESLSPGEGQAVGPERERIGRIRVPITDAGGFNTLTWRLAPAAVNRWDGTNIREEGDFVTPEPNYPLCESPLAPQLVGPADTVICSNEPIVLRSTFAGTQQWFLDGLAIAGAVTDSLVPMQPGTYRVVALHYSCVSDSSNASKVGVRWVTEPVLRRDNRLLVANVATDVRWYRNGERMPNVSGASFVLRESGRYHIETPSDCGLLLSNTVEVDFASEPVVTTDSSATTLQFSAYPNPYPSFTYLSYTLENSTHVTLDITTVNGILVTRLVDEPHSAGKFKVRFSAQELGQPTGTYLARLITDTDVRIVKVIEGA